MNRPEDIPERVWAEAIRHVGTSPNTDEERLLIARSILAAEQRVREECAQKADKYALEAFAVYEGDAAAAGREIAAAIRKGGEHA